MIIAYAIIGLSLALAIYTYLGYPLLVRLMGRRTLEPPGGEPEDWPVISFSIPAYNEELEIAGTLDSLLAIDYPAEKRQIIVVSDASTDRTDEIVLEYDDQGVQLVRQPERKGKTAAEELAAEHARGEIVINSDASIRIRPDAIRALVAQFRDPWVGVASGVDMSVSRLDEEQNVGEAGYVGYEMSVREAETRLRGIVGASGCLYAIRADLHRLPLPQDLSRDFAAALHAEEHGFRAVSVPSAVCFVPRTASLQGEYRRKTRTIKRGMRTLWHKRHLLNPLRYPVFAWMLWSHKIARWTLPWAALASFIALGALATQHIAAAVVFSLGIAVLLLGASGWALANSGIRLPAVLSIPAFVLMGNAAAASAFVAFIFGQQQAVWEPTRRGFSSDG